MSKKNKVKAKSKDNTAQVASNRAPLLPQIIVKAPNRRSSDIATWRNALRSADSGRVKALFDLFEDLLIDTTLFQSWNKRIEAVNNAELVFQLDNSQSSDDVDELMNSLSWEKLIEGIMNYKGFGRGGAEVTFNEGFSAKIIPPKHINLNNQTILINDTDERGIDYTTDPHLIVLGERGDFGLFLRSAPYVIYKRGGFGDYAQWLELFGMPQRIGKYSSYDPQSRILLETALKEAGSAPWLVVPKESDIETVNNTGNGSSGSSFNEFRQACNEEILITISGNTLTTIAGTKGARSLGDVHKEVEEAINKADMRFVEKVLNTYFVPLLEQRGFNVKGGRFVFPAAVEPLTVTEIISLSDIIDIPAWWVHDKYGIPAPQDGDKLARKNSTEAEPQNKKDDEPDDPKKDSKADKAPKDKKPKEKEDPEADDDEKLADDRKLIWQLWDKSFGRFFADAPTKWSGALRNFKERWTRRTTGKITLGDSYTIDIEKLMQEAIREVYDSKGGELVNKKLFDITNDALQDAVDTSLSRNDVDEDFVRQFKENTAVFAAFKNHQQTKEIVALMYDEDGKLVPFYKFKKRALQISEKYNVQWLRTEYNTAVRRARAAANFLKYKKTAHLYPNLEYMETRSAVPRDEHLVYVGTVLPIEDLTWDWLAPPSDFNCDCWLRPTDKEVTARPMKPSDWNNIFTGNPAKTAEFLNTKETPYYKHTDEKLRDKVTEEGKRLLKEQQDAEEIYEGKKGGYVIIEPQGKNERDKNLTTYKLLADDGGKYKLRKAIEGQKNPDAVNLSNSLLSDAKHPEIGHSVKNAIQNGVKDASKQKAQEVVFRFDEEVQSKDIYEGLQAAFQEYRNRKIKMLILIRKDRKPIYLDVEKLREHFRKTKK